MKSYIRTRRNGLRVKCALVENVEHPILASVLGAVFDKVVGPDIVAPPGRSECTNRRPAQSLPRLRCS